MTNLIANLPPPIPTPDRARMYAGIMHGAQIYDDGVPYVIHLEYVVDVLKKFGWDSADMVCAGWLHDAIEDTTANYNAIKERFGGNVAELVYAVTSEQGRNREERNKKTYPKIRGNEYATALKLADRIANMEFGLSNGGGMVAKYQKEYPGFKDAIKMPNGQEDGRVTKMWAFLDLLSSHTV